MSPEGERARARCWRRAWARRSIALAITLAPRAAAAEDDPRERARHRRSRLGRDGDAREAMACRPRPGHSPARQLRLRCASISEGFHGVDLCPSAVTSEGANLRV